MEYDWLWGLPRAELETQEAMAAQALRDDPAAAAITDDEAEAFFSASWVLRNMGTNMTTWVARRIGLRLSRVGDKKSLRRTTLYALRRWNQPRIRQMLLFLVTHTSTSYMPDVATCPTAWSDAGFAHAYEEGAAVVWLVSIRRHLGQADDLEAWLESLSPYAARHFRLFLDYAKLTLRRLVYPEAAVVAAVAETAAAALLPASADLEQELQAKDQATTALRHHVRRLERDRKQLRVQSRRAELQNKAMLAQARGEVAAARKALREDQAACSKALADQARQFDRQIAGLQREIDAARAEFCRTLAAIAAEKGVPRPLEGRTFTLPEPPPADPEACRLLARSLGGALVPVGGEPLPGPAASLADLERGLRQAALQLVLIKCDGLYRQKEGRPGIAASAFEVHAGGQVIFRHGEVTCSGSAASSLMAEYGAAAMALRWLHSARLAPGARAEIWIDCRDLVCELRRPEPNALKRGCVQLDRVARRLLQDLRQRGCQVVIRWVPRDEVYAVDRLCELVYRESTWYHRRRNSAYNVPLRRFLRSARLYA